MLKLDNIVKVYSTGETRVEALRGVDISFRSNEFVSILGPSGCGKTTLLNIIGGLDHYTDGDLTIGGKSTKDFSDRDWDTYRNHSVGFVFQSYNLIPHQSVLQNVELALTLSGVSKSERRRRAREALDRVGLGNQYKKKPSEMSGGQMQRVAIARAIVNNPDIILADEPTGALDTETSVQVMEILKEISNDRLVVMVTHNPELAEKYSTRIIRMVDGQILGDSNPLSEKEIELEKAKSTGASNSTGKSKKPSMSFATSFGLSLKNLFTKKGRTALTSFAGSIGIIGIALILAVSQGMTAYINTVQEETLSSYPLTLESENVDVTSLLQTFMGVAESVGEHENDAVYQKAMVYQLINALNTMEVNENDLRAFKQYIEQRLEDESNDDVTTLNDALSGIQYSYDLDLLVYTKNIDGEIIHSDSEALMSELLSEMMGADFSKLMSSSASMGGISTMPTMSTSTWQEMLPGKNGSYINPLLEKQYDMVYGSWPNSYDEIVLVLDSNNELDDMALYALGLKSKGEIDKIIDAAINKTELKYEQQSWSYEEICDMEFRVIINSDCYTLDEQTGVYTDLRESSAGLKYLYDNALVLKVSGIIRPNPDAVATMLTGSIGYTSELTEHIVEKSKQSSAINAQMKSEGVDIFNGLPFGESSKNIPDAEKEIIFRDYISKLGEAGKAEAYITIMSTPSKESIDAFLEGVLGAMTPAQMREQMTSALATQMNMTSEDISAYLNSMSDEEISAMFAESSTKQYTAQYAEQIKAQLAAMSEMQLAAALDASMQTYTTEQCAVYHDKVLEFSNSSYEANMQKLGYVELDDPARINLFASSFENKDVIEDFIAEYNEGASELSKISYTDYVGIMMSSITTIINAITYVLIAFVAVSLVVSSIMIGVITLISVQERTKEIGILRAIGASKRNVSSMFNAETVIIGFASGVLGVVVTYLLCIPINLILHALTGINNLSAYLPAPAAVILVCISVLLTLISGIIPSRSAAKKDPVVALRTE